MQSRERTPDDALHVEFFEQRRSLYRSAPVFANGNNHRIDLQDGLRTQRNLVGAVHADGVGELVFEFLNNIFVHVDAYHFVAVVAETQAKVRAEIS